MKLVNQVMNLIEEMDKPLEKTKQDTNRQIIMNLEPIFLNTSDHLRHREFHQLYKEYQYLINEFNEYDNWETNPILNGRLKNIEKKVKKLLKDQYEKDIKDVEDFEGLSNQDAKAKVDAEMMSKHLNPSYFAGK